MYVTFVLRAAGLWCSRFFLPLSVCTNKKGGYSSICLHHIVIRHSVGLLPVEHSENL